jgi:hypothetical protein
MEHKLTVTVSEDVYEPLAEEASRHGHTPEEEATLRLQQSLSRRNGERRPGALEELFGSISLGYPTDMTNETIDRDIVRGYFGVHSDEGER